MSTFITETGSVYEVDTDGRRARRLAGKADPTANMKEDGQWRGYQAVRLIAPGLRVMFEWGFETRGDGLKYRQTLTSQVTEVRP